jgi:transcriptional regulator with XRE-family HTH domain
MIRQRREERDLTQIALAKHAKVSRGYLAALETGIEKNPSLPTLRRLARALGVAAGELPA